MRSGPEYTAGATLFTVTVIVPWSELSEGSVNVTNAEYVPFSVYAWVPDRVPSIPDLVTEAALVVPSPQLIVPECMSVWSTSVKGTERVKAYPSLVEVADGVVIEGRSFTFDISK